MKRFRSEQPSTNLWGKKSCNERKQQEQAVQQAEEGDEGEAEGEEGDELESNPRLQALLKGEAKDGEAIEVHGRKMIAQVHSSCPSLLALHHFCSADEAAKILRTAEAQLAFKRSEVGMGIHSMRTSESAEVQPTDSPELLEVCRRIMSFSDQPNTIVQLVVVRYQPGQQFHLHHDGEFRRYTFLLYLNEPDEHSSPSSCSSSSIPPTSRTPHIPELAVSPSSAPPTSASSSSLSSTSPSSASSPASSSSASSSSLSSASPSSASSPAPSSLPSSASVASSFLSSDLGSATRTLSVKQGSGYLSRDEALTSDDSVVPTDSHGETFFPELNVRIRPKTGTAVVWRNNVTEADGTVSADLRMLHAGLPPSSGTKYVLNCWILEESTLIE